MTQHGGNIDAFAQRIGCIPQQVVDFSANLNPEQALDWRQLPDLALTPYPDPHYTALKHALRLRYPLPEGADLEVFNGASAAIFALLKCLQPKDVTLYTPLYGEYAQAATQLGCRLHNIDRFSALDSAVPANSTVIFVNPSTPDGQYYDIAYLFERWRAANCTVIVDESFLDFCDGQSVIERLAKDDNVYLIKSLSKFYGCAGIRIGFVAAASAAIAELKRLEPAWKLSTFDMAYMQTALANTAFIERTYQQNGRLRDHLYQVLSESGLFAQIYPSSANFLLTCLAQMDGYSLQQRLESARILIRVCDSFVGLDKQHVRFAVKSRADIDHLAMALQHV